MPSDEALTKLRALRDRLTNIEPFPWPAVEAWIASAMPLMRAEFNDHLADFTELTKRPRFLMLPRVVGRRSSSWIEPVDHHRPNNEADAIEQRENPKIAARARDKIVNFLDSVLDLPTKVQRLPDAPLDRVLALLERFHVAVRSLVARGRGRTDLVINDEYDVQYLLGAFLALHFDDVRPEEWTPSYAGNASRMDYLLKRERIVIETKYATTGHADKAITNELIIDRDRYAAHADCDVLVCFVYDPTFVLKNQRAIEADLARAEKPHTIVLVRPK